VGLQRPKPGREDKEYADAVTGVAKRDRASAELFDIVAFWSRGVDEGIRAKDS